MNRRIWLNGAAVCLLLLLTAGAAAQRGAPRRKPQPKGAVCGDPTVACKTSATFEPYDLPFRISERAVIWESEPFYAVVLKSVRAPNDDCQKFVPEAERQAAQRLFPNNKVFTSRCADAGSLYYTGTAENVHFMAVYAGRTRAEAARLLEQVKTTGQFPGANLRQMSIGFNGT
ncbi:MAG TPA: hypothetical protein VF546_19380 [Pyrinomonadaceae bacterium]|jgi:hypothetical protein